MDQSAGIHVRATLLDKVVALVLVRALPVRFDVVQSDTERVAIYRMRHTTVVERGWAPAEDFSDGLEIDEFDECALHIIGKDGDKPVASARLVFPSSDKSLPTELSFGLRILPHGRVVDMGRQIVVRAHSDLQHVIFAGLLARCWQEVNARGYKHVCGDFTPSMVRLYRMMGMSVTILGPPKPYWGEDRVPILVDVLETVDTLAARYLTP